MLIEVDEHTYQVALFNWARIMEKKVTELEMLMAIPLGGKRHIKVAQKLKAEGVKRGYPDIVLNISRGGYHNLFIEMKVKGKYPTPEQKEWHTKLRKQGSMVVICYSNHEAQNVIMDYLKEHYKKEEHNG